MNEWKNDFGLCHNRGDYTRLYGNMNRRIEDGYSKLIITTKENLKETIQEMLINALEQEEHIIKIYNDDPLAHLPQKPVEPPKCQHKWRDYDWYMEYSLDRNPNVGWVLSYKIFEPYVCTLCHDRNNMMLESGKISLESKDDLAMALSKIMSLYPKIRARAIVEDEINDDIHVDREYLKWADFLAGRREATGGKDIQLKLTYERSGADAVERKEGGKETA